MAISVQVITFFSNIASGRESPITPIIKAIAVPSGIPFATNTCTTRVTVYGTVAPADARAVVFNSRTGKPLAGVTVLLRKNAGGDIAPVTTGMDGVASFTGGGPAADIKDLDGALPLKRPFDKKCPWVSPLGFKAYLTQAIHNTFANWCRTHKRKFRDLTFGGAQVFTPTASGDYIQSGFNEDSFDWESRLVAVALNDEDLLSVVESVEQECAEEDIALRDETGALSSRGREILDYIADGRTVQEAIAAQQRAENRLRVRSA